VGCWEGDRRADPWPCIFLYPDGYYLLQQLGKANNAKGRGCALFPDKTFKNAFVLRCGDDRFLVRSEWGSGVLEFLNEDGSTQLRLLEAWHLEGSWHNGSPCGKWAIVY